MKKNFSQLVDRKKNDRKKWIKCINQCESLEKGDMQDEKKMLCICRITWVKAFFVPKIKHLGKTKLNLNLYQQ